MPQTHGFTGLFRCWRERTSISDVEQHGNKDIVHEVQSDAVSKQSIPHHQKVLKRKLTTKQQTNPPAAEQKSLTASNWVSIKYMDEMKVEILTCHRFGGRSPAGLGACAAPRRASSPAGPGCGWLWSRWPQKAQSPGAERTGCWSASLPYPEEAAHYFTGTPRNTTSSSSTVSTSSKVQQIIRQLSQQNRSCKFLLKRFM